MERSPIVFTSFSNGCKEKVKRTIALPVGVVQWVVRWPAN